MSDELEGYTDPDDEIGLIDTWHTPLPQAAIEHNARLGLGAGTLPPEIRNIGRELAAAGKTAPAARTINSDHATVVTIAEAAARTGVSVQTWRRRLKAGHVSGAYKAAGAQGEQWQIPVTALDTIAAVKASPPISATSETISDLQTELAKIKNELALQRALADERLQTLDQLHATMRALGAGLNSEKQKPKRWWNRSH